jgi:glycosyltransferase involved in cell wall biosynthesis
MSKRVLYIGNYKDGTGWGNAAAHNILALHSAGVDVVPRAITFEEKQTESPEISALEKKPATNIDVCIQHTLPPLYSYNSSFKNVALYETETNSFDDSLWHKYINLLDEAWVPNTQMIKASQMSGVNIDIKLAPHCVDVRQYEDVQKTAMVGDLESTFNFCFVGELSKRKNISALLKAFYLEFHPTEPVNLLLKINRPGTGANDCLQIFNQFNEEIKAGLKLGHSYKKPAVVCGFLEKPHLLSVMKQCHAFVCTSFGEAWCIPALEAMALGMPVLYTEGTGMDDFCSGFPIKSESVPCNGAIDTLPNVYTAFSSWQEVDIEDLCIKMRNIYEIHKQTPSEYQELSDTAMKEAQKYSLEETGKKLKELL